MLTLPPSLLRPPDVIPLLLTDRQSFLFQAQRGKTLINHAGRMASSGTHT